MDKLHKQFNFEVKGGEAGTRRIEAIASAPSIDRDGEIISIEALKAALPGYLRNPVILASHTHKNRKRGIAPSSASVSRPASIRRGCMSRSNSPIRISASNTGSSTRTNSSGHSRSGLCRFGYEERVIDGKRVRVLTEIELMEISCVAVPSQSRRPEQVGQAQSEICGTAAVAVERAGELCDGASGLTCGRI